MPDPTNTIDADLDEDERVIAAEAATRNVANDAAWLHALREFDRRARTRWPVLVARERERIVTREALDAQLFDAERARSSE